MSEDLRLVTLPGGEQVPALGLGTWKIGERASARRDEVAAVRAALDIGYRLIDTAEMYGDGGSQEVVGEALAGRRDEVFLVSKVYPHNASRAGTVAACEASLRRLRTDRIDLYLLHWRGAVPLAETVAAFEGLKRAGKIRHWGVSNCNVSDMEELWSVANGPHCAANQIYYSASRRGVEFDLLPWLRERGVPAMAYCPIDEGVLVRDATLAAIGKPHGASAAQVALAWILRRPDVIAIPKAIKLEHLRQNFAAARLQLSEDELAQIDRHFKPPTRRVPLAIV
jgi:diketogulonate reductase-like aldo/keto reductase